MLPRMFGFPWEMEPEPSDASTQTGLAKPGCVAADNTIVALGHLDGLARGLGGFGVLRVSKQRLEEAATAADQLGEFKLALALSGVAGRIPGVHTQEEARALAEELQPLVDQAWELGLRCKGQLTPEEMQRARRIARPQKRSASWT